MSRQISERDWKVFRDVHQLARDRLYEKALADAQAVLARPGQTPQERYQALCRLLDTRDEELVRVFDDFRRSTALIQLGIMDSMGLLTAEDIARFSPEVHELLAFFAQGRKPNPST